MPPRTSSGPMPWCCPGWARFARGWRTFADVGLQRVLEDEVRKGGKPFLGICLGMQLLAREGLEHGRTPGLGWIPGRVEKIRSRDPRCRIPHIGWNDVVIHRPDDPLFKEMGSLPVYYFVHSYHLNVDADARSLVVATCHHGEEITAAVRSENIFGVQFHPEKSQRAGLKLLQNFIQHAEACRHG